MAPRDYKHAAPRANGKQANQARYGSWVSFASGLGIGLVVALGVYLWSASLPRPAAVVEQVTDEIADSAAPTVPPAATLSPAATPPAAGEDLAEPSLEPPPPKFDFYKILPEMEVPVQDWELSEDAADEPETPLTDGAYVLQVGSFKNFEDADRAKASLALRGITANVQRVVINGQDVWFRVHVGPVSDVATLRALRMKLTEIDMDFILLRIGDPAVP